MAGTANTAWYRLGTVDVTKGSPTVTGTGTRFLSAGINQGAAFRVDAHNDYACEIAEVVSDTELRLAKPYERATASGQTYSIDRNHQSTLLAFLAARIANLTGNFEAHYDLDMKTIHGASAYEIACDNGFVGTESQWLQSLIGGGEWTTLRDSVNSSISAFGTRLSSAEATVTTIQNRTTAMVDGEASGGAGYRNTFFRGKNLGNTLTSEMSAAIRANVFTDLFLGDYFQFQNVAYSYEDENGATQNATWSGRMRLAAFDYFMATNGGTGHHVMVVPDGSLFNAYVNNENNYEGGYAGSLMHTVHMKRAAAIFEACFGADHIRPFNVAVSNNVIDGKAVGVVFLQGCKAELMTEEMVWGFTPLSNYNSKLSVTCSRLPLFTAANWLASNGSYWLQDVCNATNVCCVLSGCPDRRAPTFHYNGEGPNYSHGVRPFALIY